MMRHLGACIYQSTMFSQRFVQKTRAAAQWRPACNARGPPAAAAARLRASLHFHALPSGRPVAAGMALPRALCLLLSLAGSEALIRVPLRRLPSYPLSSTLSATPRAEKGLSIPPKIPLENFEDAQVRLRPPFRADGC